MFRFALVAATLVLMCAGSVQVRAADEPAWVAPMKAVHAKGKGVKGSVSQIGDSITFTMAFMSFLAWNKPAGFEAVTGYINGAQTRERKGAEHCNYSGWTSGDGLSKIKQVLDAEKPEIAVIMYGTNDVTKGVPLDTYRKNMAAIIDACTEAGCVPIVSTIPPYPGKDDKAKALNEELKKLVGEKKVPLVDFYAAVVERQPGEAWNGTLLGKGDVHPTGGESQVFTEDNLKKCGYALRNYVTLVALKDVIEKAFK
ncbi:MAG: SGNH/GDSL hydrolase family protein [Planctomycetes bacterium]|nr:SGNH/GDSL hydrolase family protein [Planctomycetota bacterium]